MNSKTPSKVITFADLFSGIGGFRLGIENAAKRLGIPVECVFSSEIEKNAVKIYEKNFKETPSGDITQIQASDIPDIDILCGGFPCQDASIAGKRKGLKGERTGLFFDIIRILQEKQPSIVFLENVKGLFSCNGGWDFARILIELEDAGYSVEWNLLDSEDYGVPQHRERIYIVGHLRSKPSSKIFPLFGETDRVCDKSSKPQERVCQIASTLTKRAYASWNGNYVIYPVLDPIRPNKTCNGRRIKEEGEPSYTLTKFDRHGVLINNRIRIFTPEECELLQGFPRGWTEGIEDKYRYECLGNAVTVNVIEAIAERILEGL